MAGRSQARPPASTLPSKFRLIVADPSISGGSIMQMLELPAQLTMGKIAALLEGKPAFRFQELCERRGATTLDVQIRLTGMDGQRRCPLHTDADIEIFLNNLQISKIPVIEAQLPQETLLAKASEHHQRGVQAGRQRGRDPRDQIEELEDANFKLTRATDRVERRLAELERLIATTDERTERTVGIARREMTEVLDKAIQDVNQKIVGLKEDDAGILRDLDEVRQHSNSVKQLDAKHHKEILDQLDAFGLRVDEQFDEVNGSLDKLQEEDYRLDAEAQATKEDHKLQLEAHLDELQRLEETKVSVNLWQSEGNAMAERITKDVEALKEQMQQARGSHLPFETANHANAGAASRPQEQSERVARDDVLDRSLQDTTSRLDGELAKLDADTQDKFKEARDALEDARQSLSTAFETQVSELSGKTEKHFDQLEHTIDHKDEKIHTRVDELTAKSEATFQSIAERLDAMVQEERARLGQLNQDLSESVIKVRSDLHSAIERVRTDYEEEAARLDADLGDLHMKYDVAKQEINFFQSKLKEQRDWTEKCLAESGAVTRAAALESQEGLAATTKMLHALRDDAVSFREKMAKYISILQHSSDQQGEALNSLELNRTSMRAELDALLKDHQEYTGDMDSWAKDTNVQVERVFRALEPTKVEWRIERAMQKSKELRKPLALKSASFGIKGIPEGFMEFYPEGNNNSPEGKAVLRLYVPPQAHIRYQCWVGKDSDGAKERAPSSDTLYVDMFLTDWEDQLTEEGAVLVLLEVLRDYNNDDASLSREIRINSA
ncbi:unnamed protein product [Symbiodinium pilosum]|uniref:Uncharacterized protein n=1 Tax=Symbiodinium pilosum TaxID=2952 RepID=A0A812K9E7_SYMPI|nr:unnamed protein product [Symbiodinium pilosum]